MTPGTTHHSRLHLSAYRAACFVALLFASSGMEAQGIRGTVVDTMGRPIAAAELTLTPTDIRARTDSAGRFAFPSVSVGRYVLRTRAITYVIRDMEIDVPAGGVDDVRVVMTRVTPMLAEVRARAQQDQCQPTTLDGFECRRQAGVGYFRDLEDFAELKPQQFATLFHGLPGIRPRMIKTPHGYLWMPGVRPSRCMVELVNGRPPFVPLSWWRVDDVVAIEYYDDPRKVPVPFRSFLGPSCDIIIYWLYNARKGG